MPPQHRLCRRITRMTFDGNCQNKRFIHADDMIAAATHDTDSCLPPQSESLTPPHPQYIDLISASQPPQVCNTRNDINLVYRAFCRPFKCMLIRTLWKGEPRPWYLDFRVAEYTDSHGSQEPISNQFISPGQVIYLIIFAHKRMPANSTPANASVFSSPLLLIGNPVHSRYTPRRHE